MGAGDVILRGVKVGLLSDVHGNLAGLRAVAAALAREGPLDAVVVAGDHVGAGPRPREVWEELGCLGWTLVRGNDDEELATDFRIVGFQNGDEDALRAMIADPYVIVGGSDGGAHVAFICQTAYSSHLLGYWVRDKGALSLEAAVRRLTEVGP